LSWSSSPNTEGERKETNIDPDNEDLLPETSNTEGERKETNIDPDNEDMLPVTSNTGDEQTSASVAAPTAVPNNIIGELINLIYIRNILKLKVIFELKMVVFNSLVCNLTSLWHSWIQLVGV
jgi:hypothetical protein